MPDKKFHKINPSVAKERVANIWPILKRTYPNAKCSLEHVNPLELLISTILAAQCTDERVNIVTKNLYKKYRTAADWAAQDVKVIEQEIKSTGFYRNKAKNIKAACEIIARDFAGKVPDTMEDLLKLPGVGRKTANVILGNCFNTPGIICDTHVIRLSRRLGLSTNDDPAKLEYDLMEIVPKRNWTLFSNLLVFHGRNICNARRPDCEKCPIANYCPSAGRKEYY